MIDTLNPRFLNELALVFNFSPEECQGRDAVDIITKGLKIMRGTYNGYPRASEYCLRILMSFNENKNEQ